MGVFRDITGKQFGRWAAVRPIRSDAFKSVRWLFKCTCGNEKVLDPWTVVSGHSKSCGCWGAEQASKRFFKHGMRHTPEYGIWCTMKARCHQKNAQHYECYGGRGITVCDRWYKSFSAFIADMGRRPENARSIDRIDNDKGYCKDNCRWATQTQQMRNTSVNRIIKYKGEEHPLIVWADILKISYAALRRRLDSHMTIEQAFTRPMRRTRRGQLFITYKGKRRSLAEWAKLTDITRQVIYDRFYRQGWSAHETLSISKLDIGIKRREVD